MAARHLDVKTRLQGEDDCAGSAGRKLRRRPELPAEPAGRPGERRPGTACLPSDRRGHRVQKCRPLSGLDRPGKLEQQIHFFVGKMQRRWHVPVKVLADLRRAPGAASPEDIASQRVPPPRKTSFWIAACSFARPLGRAEARRGDHLSDLDVVDNLLRHHGLHRAARGQAGRRGAARTLAGIEPLVVYFATIVDVGGPGFWGNRRASRAGREASRLRASPLAFQRCIAHVYRTARKRSSASARGRPIG